MGAGRGVPVAVGFLAGVGKDVVGSGVGLGVAVAVGVAVGAGVSVGVKLGVAVGVQVSVGVEVGVALDCGDAVTVGVTVSGAEVRTGVGVADGGAASGVWLCSTIGVGVDGSPALDSGRRTRNNTRITTTPAATAAMGIQGVRGIHGGLLRTGGICASREGPWTVATRYRGQATQPSAKQAVAW